MEVFFVSKLAEFELKGSVEKHVKVDKALFSLVLFANYFY